MFGLNAPRPSGPLSPALRSRMLAQVCWWWFRVKVRVWGRLPWRDALNWSQFQADLEAAEYREYGDFLEALRSVRYIGQNPNSAAPQWQFAASRCLRCLPV